MNRKNNLVLIGMPTCGKSTIGFYASEELKLEFVDTDALVEAADGRRIADIFAVCGEEYFRGLESAAVAKAADMRGALISCGGGVIKRAENIAKLRENGLIVFIDRKLSLLCADSSRPLSSSRADLEKIYYERIASYREYADIVIENNDDERTALLALCEAWQASLRRYNEGSRN